MSNGRRLLSNSSCVIDLGVWAPGNPVSDGVSGAAVVQSYLDGPWPPELSKSCSLKPCLLFWAFSSNSSSLPAATFWLSEKVSLWVLSNSYKYSCLAAGSRSLALVLLCS